MPNEEIKLKPCPFCGGEAKALLGYILHLDENGNEVGFYEESTSWKDCEVVQEGRTKRLEYYDFGGTGMVKRIPIRRLDGVVHYYTVEEQVCG